MFSWLKRTLNFWSPKPQEQRLEDASRAKGQTVLAQITTAQALYTKMHNKPPQLLHLPILLAYELLRLDKTTLGDELIYDLWRKGVVAFETHGLLGMQVKIVRSVNAVISFE